MKTVKSESDIKGKIIDGGENKMLVLVKTQTDKMVSALNQDRTGDAIKSLISQQTEVLAKAISGMKHDVRVEHDGEAIRMLAEAIASRPTNWTFTVKRNMNGNIETVTADGE